MGRSHSTQMFSGPQDTSNGDNKRVAEKLIQASKTLRMCEYNKAKLDQMASLPKYADEIAAANEAYTTVSLAQSRSIMTQIALLHPLPLKCRSRHERAQLLVHNAVTDPENHRPGLRTTRLL